MNICIIWTTQSIFIIKIYEYMCIFMKMQSRPASKKVKHYLITYVYTKEPGHLTLKHVRFILNLIKDKV